MSLHECMSVSLRKLRGCDWERVITVLCVHFYRRLLYDGYYCGSFLLKDVGGGVF